MHQSGKVQLSVVVKMLGALIGAIGFMLIGLGNALWGTSLIGIGSVIIAGGESL